MKTFEYAKTRKHFKMPSIKTTNYNIPVWALPIAPFIIAYDKISKWANDRRVWDEEKARKVLDRALPYVLEYVAEDDAYWYCMEWSEWRLADHAPLGLKKWAKKFFHNLHFYLEENYENPNYTKTIERDDWQVWLKFEKKG